MVTATAPNRRIAALSRSQSETTVSDFEIARRVVAIRSQWTPQEKIERHHEAVRRFDSLLEALEQTEVTA